MRNQHLLILVVALLGGASSALAAPRELKLTLEPGLAGLSLPLEERAWGWVGGASLGFSLTSQIWIQVHASVAGFPRHDPALAGTTVATTLVYHLDVASISPYFGIGWAWSAIRTTDGQLLQTETLATLEAGFDVKAHDWLLWGVVIRYYPLFDSDLLGHPAYATVHGRIGAVFNFFD